MPKRAPSSPTQRDFNAGMCARVKLLRDRKGWTQAEAAEALGISEERFRKYETRSPLPHYLVPRYARITDSTIEYVMTGREPEARRPIGRPPTKVAS